MDCTIDIGTLIKIFGVGVIPPALLMIILFFFGKSIVNFFFNNQLEEAKSRLAKEQSAYQSQLAEKTEKRLSQYKIDLEKEKSEHQNALNEKINQIEREAELKLAKYHSQLEQLNYQYQVKLSGLHAKRLEILETLYEKMVSLQKTMANHIRNWKEDTGDDYQDEEEKTRSEAAKSFDSFSTFFLGKRLYFSEDLCEKIDELIKAYYDAFTQYEGASREQSEATSKEAREAQKRVATEIPVVLNEISNQFRQMLGVNNFTDLDTESEH